MKCNEIYEAALSHIGVVPYSEGSEEYEKLAPYLLCAVCYEMSNTDKEYRIAKGEAQAKAWDGLSLPLSADFPLSPRFSSAAAFCLASSLVASTNDKLADEFYMRYNQSMNKIVGEIQATVTGTRNVYPE